MKNSEKIMIEQLFTDLGFLLSEYSFDHIVQSKEARKMISKFPDSDPSRILRYSPDYFAMPSDMRGSSEENIRKVKQQIFFIILMDTDIKILKDALDIYKKYYKPDNIIVFIIDRKREDVFIKRLSEAKLSLKKGVAEIKVSEKDTPENFFIRIGVCADNEELNRIMAEFRKDLFSG